MSNLLLAYSNKADAGVLAAGSWSGALPLVNVQDKRLGIVARTSSAALSSTRFREALAAAYTLRAVALPAHNLTTAGRWRVRGGTAPLDLLFDNDAVDERITCTGGANGTRFDSTGAMVAATCPRIDYDPATLAYRGLYVEEARTNLFLNSLLNGTNLSTQSVTLTAVPTTVSFYGTGTVTLSGASTAGPLVGTGATNKVKLTFTPSAGSVTFTVTGTVKWANLEVGAFDTSFIPTAGAPVTRTADRPLMTATNFSSWFNASEGTFLVEAISSANVVGRLFQVDDGSTYAQLIDVYRSSVGGGQFGSEIYSGGVAQAAMVEAGNTPQVGAVSRCALSYKLNNMALSAGGATPVTDTAGVMPVAPVRLAIGYEPVGNNAELNGWVRRLTFWPTITAGAQLQTLSTAGATGGADAPGLNTGWLNALQLTFQGDTPADWGMKYPLMATFSAVSVRYLTVEISDAANPAGYVQFGRFFVADAFQPATGASYGLQSGRDDLSSVTTSVSGVRYATARRRPRTEKFTLQYTTQAEADRIHEMYDEIGTVDEVLYIPDPSDSAYSQRYGFLGYLEQLGPLDYPIPLRRSIAFQVKEKI